MKMSYWNSHTISCVVFVLLSNNFIIITTIDYCKICENGTHTLCKYKKGPSPSCKDFKNAEMTADLKKLIVDIHNDIRNNVASGREVRGPLGGQPSASNMFALKWDNELAEIAERWTEQCLPLKESVQYDTCRRTSRFDVGQNMLMAVTKSSAFPDIAVLMMTWYKQVTNVLPTDVDRYKGFHRERHRFGQYSQLVWAKTQYVGCAFVRYRLYANESTPDHQFLHRLVCNYGPTGNVIGMPIYLRGEPCSKCPNKLCNKDRSSLCQGVVPNSTEKTETYESNEAIEHELNDKLKILHNLLKKNLFHGSTEEVYYVPDWPAENEDEDQNAKFVHYSSQNMLQPHEESPVLFEVLELDYLPSLANVDKFVDDMYNIIKKTYLKAKYLEVINANNGSISNKTSTTKNLADKLLIQDNNLTKLILDEQNISTKIKHSIVAFYENYTLNSNNELGGRTSTQAFNFVSQYQIPTLQNSLTFDKDSYTQDGNFIGKTEHYVRLTPALPFSGKLRNHSKSEKNGSNQKRAEESIKGITSSTKGNEKLSIRYISDTEFIVNDSHSDSHHVLKLNGVWRRGRCRCNYVFRSLGASNILQFSWKHILITVLSCYLNLLNIAYVL